MILTITWEGRHTQDLGFLLWKHPQRAQQFELSFGGGYGGEAGHLYCQGERCTSAAGGQMQRQ